MQGSIEKVNDIFKLRLAALRQGKRLLYIWVHLPLDLQEVINTTPSRKLPCHMAPFGVWVGLKIVFVKIHLY